MTDTLNEDLLYKALGWCGCSDGHVTAEFERVLKSLIEAHNKNDSHYSAEVLDQIILCELDRLGITEHGIAVRGSWLPGGFEEPWTMKRVNEWLQAYSEKNIEVTGK